MLAFIAFINKFFAIFTILSLLGLAFLFFYFLYYRKKGESLGLLSFLNANFVLFSFLISLFAVIISLFYSEIVGYEPCSLCWFQRVFIYPTAIISGIALWKKKDNIADYVLGLSAFGAVFAAYNHLIQVGFMPSVFCTASAVSCAKRYIFEFGFVTMPLMSFVLFAFLIALAFFKKNFQKA